MLWFWWIYGALVGTITLFVALDALFGIPRVARLDAPEWDRWPKGNLLVTVIVPACNEQEDIRECLASLLAQDYAALEIIAVNDRSTDRTGAIMDEVAAQSGGRLRVLHIAKLPPHWLGKTHAMWSASNQARGEWILFTDADVIYRPDTLRRALAYAEDMRLAHVVLGPTMEFHAFGERLMLSLFQFGLIAARLWKVPDPRSRAHVGAGAFNLVRADAYRAIGGFGALRLEVIEDMKLGERLKQSGYLTHAAFGPDMIRLHWASGAVGMAHTLTKNVYALFHYRWWWALAGVVFVLAVHVAPFGMVWLAPGWSKLGFVVCLAGILLVYLLLWPLTRIHPLFFLTHPLAVLLGVYATLRSIYFTMRDGGVTWRGTFYPIAMLKKGSG